jgi:hypothetical protein
MVVIGGFHLLILYASIANEGSILSLQVLALRIDLRAFVVLFREVFFF